MEFAVVRFPARRNVNVDGVRNGTTNTVLRLPAGPHTFDLGQPLSYKPASQMLTVFGTTKAEPAEIVFEQRSDATVATADGQRRAPVAAAARRRASGGRRAVSRSAPRPSTRGAETGMAQDPAPR